MTTGEQHVISAQDEELVAVYLRKHHNLIAETFDKDERRKGKTPDFRVMKEGRLVFYCEVETIERDDWRGGGRPDPRYNRLTTHIHQAAAQFDAVNRQRRYPNVLFFVNHDNRSNFGHLHDVFTGDIECDDGTRHPIYRKYSEGRIKAVKWRIDLYVWWDADKSNSAQQGRYGDCAEHVEALRRYFAVDPRMEGY